ncbi:MAG: hypothetical protein C0482_19955 [Gordonia sp.]|jgi:hypothetical protein|uniref:Cupin domain-containing protein n=1 Tax=Gordonia rubripertincta TaxID=36822 RepID=A0ABT4MX50_GORRU|nr:hypothetical protein [Gordonia rubripertincta]MBA4024634.1 hypothetical protein [Gordonia sp. (in: high G+C Gram-positive bacteria)]MCZ4551394.1 hypothetical protein [Gordonia rubripertincta]
MPHARPADLPNGGGGRWPAANDHFRSAQWGDLEVGYTTTAGPVDTTELNRVGGLAGGVCPCPHYGYVFEGSITAVYPDTGKPDEVISAGEVYFIPAGHVLKYDRQTNHLEFNPAFALQQCMDAMQRTADLAAQATINRTEI